MCVHTTYWSCEHVPREAPAVLRRPNLGRRVQAAEKTLPLTDSPLFFPLTPRITVLANCAECLLCVLLTRIMALGNCADCLLCVLLTRVMVLVNCVECLKCALVTRVTVLVNFVACLLCVRLCSKAPCLWKSK